MSFKKKEVLPDLELIAQAFKSTREEKNVSLEEVSNVLGIDIKYLKALEQGRLDKLPQGVYEKNFLREYALYLGIEPRGILDVYSSNVETDVKNRQKNMFVRNVSGDHHYLLVPRIIKNSLIFIFVLACILYLGLYLRNIVAAPRLVVLNPIQNITTSEYTIEVYGQTEKEVEVNINDNKVLIDKDGYFRKEVNLKTGLNNIKVTAQKRYSEISEINRSILVK